MTHVIALEAGQSSQGTSEPITPVIKWDKPSVYMSRQLYAVHGLLNIYVAKTCTFIYIVHLHRPVDNCTKM